MSTPPPLTPQVTTYSYRYWLITLLALLIPAFSVNFPDGMYYSALVLFLWTWGHAFWLRDLQSFDRLEQAMVAFWLFYGIFTLVDLNVRGPWEWTEFQEPSRFMLLIPAFVMIRRVGFDESALRWGVVLGAIAAGCWGYYQKIHLGVHRSWGGTSGLMAAFGDIGLILGIMSVALMQPLWRKHWYWKAVTVIALAMGAFASLTSGTKGGWISVPFLCWVLVELSDDPTYRKRLVVLGSCILIAVGVWWFSPFIQQRVSVIGPAIYEYFVNGAINDYSAGIRLALWHGCILIFIDNPLFGTGPGTFETQLEYYVSLGQLPAEVLQTPGPHSQPFNSLFESGIFGPLMVYGIYIAFILHCKRYLTTNKSVATAGILMAIGYMDFGLVEVIWDINNAGVFFTTMMVLIAGLLSYQAHIKKAGSDN